LQLNTNDGSISQSLKLEGANYAATMIDSVGFVFNSDSTALYFSINTDSDMFAIL